MKPSVILTGLGVVALAACLTGCAIQNRPAAPKATGVAEGTSLFWDGTETIEQYAKRVGLNATESIDLGDGSKLELVLIPAGKFLMGSPPSEPGRQDNETLHEVTITKPYYMGKYLVTQHQWKTVVGSNPSYSHCDHDSDVAMDCVTWYTAHDFCKKLSEIGHHTFRLPTEAEWERACRAGTQTAWCNGDDPSKLSEVSHPNDDNPYPPRRVGQLKPNNWGMYDVHGSVWEWCEDWLPTGDYPHGPAVDPQGVPQSEAKYGMMKVCRGGSREDEAKVKRCAFRGALQIGHFSDWFYGMRVLMEAPTK